MGQCVTWHDRRWRRALEARGLSRYSDFFKDGLGEQVWDRSTSKTFRITVTDPDDGRPVGLYLKRYIHAKQRWRFLLRRDKPTVERRNYDDLRRILGNVVPEVVATGRRQHWMMLHDAFILTVELPGVVQLDDYGREHWRCEPDADERNRQEALIRLTAELVRRMHDAGFYHIDLQWRNILVRFGDAPDRVDVFLIDAPRGGRRWFGLYRKHGQLRDLSSLDKLARLHLTRTQRLRWFKLYTGERRISRFGRRLIAAVLADRDRYEEAKARQLANRG